jgi:hypothetical protein
LPEADFAAVWARTPAAPQVVGRGVPPSRRAVRLLVCGVCAACHRVADNAPTSLTLAHRHVSRCARPLDNRKIAFGSGRLAIRASASRPLGAAPCGHFASLVRSIAPQSARLPSESFAFFGTSAGALSATVGTSAVCGSRRRSARGPRDSSALVCAIHPPQRGVWLGRNTSLRQPPPFRRRLAHPAVLARSRSHPLCLAPCPLSAHARLIRRKRSRLRLPMSHTRAKRTFGTW